MKTLALFGIGVVAGIVLAIVVLLVLIAADNRKGMR